MDGSHGAWRKKEEEVRNLDLWDENPRFPDEYFRKSEKELIDYYLHDERRFELRKFAREVAAEFDLPQVEKITVWETKGKRIVLEGNRRVAVYKLLIDPGLAKQEIDRELFEDLKNKTLISADYKLEVNIAPNKDQGLRLVDRKHKKGNNEVGWGELERRNDSVRRSKGTLQDVRRVELGKLVRALPLPKQIIDKVLAKGYITTLYRILDSEPARQKLGYRVLSDGKISIRDEGKFSKLMMVVVHNVSIKRKFGSRKNDVDSRALNSTDAIKKYLTSLSPGDVKKVEKAIQTNQQVSKRLEKTKKSRSKGSRILPSCFVIMPLSGLESVYKTVQSAWREVFGKKASVIHQMDDSNKGAKELIDTKILKNIRESNAVVSILSMGANERRLFESVPEKDRAKTFSRFFPFNVNVALETGYAIRCMDDSDATLRDCFFLADKSGKVSAYDNAKQHFFDVAHRDITAYSEDDLQKLETVLIRHFKAFKKDKGL